MVIAFIFLESIFTIVSSTAVDTFVVVAIGHTATAAIAEDTFASISPAAVFGTPSTAGHIAVAAVMSDRKTRVAAENVGIRTAKTFLVSGSKPIAERVSSF